jgi:hypothetical protein
VLIPIGLPLRFKGLVIVCLAHAEFTADS